MLNNKALIKVLLVAVGLQLGACAQSRRSVSGGMSNYWEALEVCSVNGDFDSASGCFNVQLDVTKNIIYVDVLDLAFDPSQVSYRILARRTGDQVFTVLKDKVTASSGEEIIIKNIKGGILVEEYEEFLFELTVSQTDFGVSSETAAPGKGLPIARDFTYWTELE